MTLPPLDYQRPLATRPKPTHHSTSAGWAWAMFIIEAGFRGSVIGYLFYRTNIYQWERFQNYLGPIAVYLMIDLVLMITGAIFSIKALLVPNTKHWAAVLALIGHLVLLAQQLGPEAFRR